MRPSLLRYVEPTIFMAMLIAISLFNYKTQNLWDLVDQEKDQIAKEIRQSLYSLIQQDCMSILPSLVTKNMSIKLGQYSIPSTIPYKGYFVDFLPFEQAIKKDSSIIVRYHFNVKERMQYSNWYLGLFELSVKRRKGIITGCQWVREISGGETEFHPSPPR